MSNYRSAKKIVDKYAVDIELRAHINIENWKNPEILLNGTTTDQAVRKTENLRSFINNVFQSKFEEGGQLSQLDKTFIVVNLGDVSSITNKAFKKIVTSVYGRMINNKKVEFLIVSFNEKSTILYNKNIPKKRDQGHAYVQKKLMGLKSTKGNE